MFDGLVDAHCHLSDARLFPTRAEIIIRSQAQGVCHFIQGGVDPADWLRQKQLKSEYPQLISTVFGLHPYVVAEKSTAECMKILTLLREYLPLALALGETGLDFRSHLLRSSDDDPKLKQETIFREQLALCAEYDKVPILHLVQAHEAAIKVLKDFHGRIRPGIVHSFNGGPSQAKEFLNQGLTLSIGGPLLRPQNLQLQQAVREISLESLLLESDSPDQAPPGMPHDDCLPARNEPWTVNWVADRVAEIKNVSRDVVIAQTSANLRRLFPKEIN